jgi:hypothetical protein
MGSVTKVGLLFAEPWNKPLSTAGKFQAGCYLVFTNGSGILLPVYRDPSLLWPYNQTSIPGSGPQSENAIVSGVVSDATGAFRPIYLNPALQYSYTLFSAAGAVLEPTTAIINVANTQETIEAQKISTTSRSNTIVLTNDPDLQISIPGPGTYKIEADLVWVSSSSTGNSVQFDVFYSVASAGTGGFVVFGLINNADFVGTLQLGVNGNSGDLTINNVPSQNTLHLSGTAVLTGPGTISIQWCQFGANTNVTSLCVGSALYATPL